MNIMLTCLLLCELTSMPLLVAFVKGMVCVGMNDMIFEVVRRILTKFFILEAFKLKELTLINIRSI